MHGLLLRPSQLDPDSANAVRVIAFFDQLITGRAGLDLVLRSTAELAECPVGISSPGLGRCLRSDPGAGVMKSHTVPASAVRHQLEGGTLVWVGRAGDPAPLDEILLERFAMTVAVCLNHVSLPRPQFGDPELVEVVLSRDAEPADRSRALRLLRLEPGAELRVLAATGIRAIEGRAARLGSVWALLCTGSTPEPVQPGSRWGVGPQVPAIDAARSWRAARAALRFTTTSEPVVYWESLGCLAVLDHLDHTDLTHLAHDTIMKIFDHCEDHDREQYLAWDLLLAPHHCSKKVMYVPDGDGNDVFQMDVMNAFSRHAGEQPVVVSSSALIPATDTPGANRPTARPPTATGRSPTS